VLRCLDGASNSASASWKTEIMMDTTACHALTGIGLGATMRQQLAQGWADDSLHLVRLAEVQRDHFGLHDGHQGFRAQPMPALAGDLQASGEALAVGDWVLAKPDPGGGGWLIHCRLLPFNQITRRQRDSQSREGRGSLLRQALVSNVDTALLVMGLDHDFNLRRLERYLALVRLSGVAAVLVLSKADTLTPSQCEQRLLQARALLAPHEVCLALDGRQPGVHDGLAPWLQPGQTLALLGSSGAGKSTLANTLLGPATNLTLRLTGGVRDDDSRGRHTTTVRSLLPLPCGACIIDTPGLRALRLDVDDADQLAEVFGDVARWAPLCRFRNCQHQSEPGCAVRQAVPEARLRNFHKLLREARRDQQTVLERQSELSQWKMRGREGHARAKAKRAGLT
jgi:ribosome biogenesis GTPase